MKTRCFAVLVTLAFLGFSVPAAADPCRVPDESHKHCKDRGGGGDKAVATFDVLTLDLLLNLGIAIHRRVLTQNSRAIQPETP